MRTTYCTTLHSFYALSPCTQHIFCHPTYFQRDLCYMDHFCHPAHIRCSAIECIHSMFRHPTYTIHSVTLRSARSSLHRPFLPPCMYSKLRHRMHTFNVPSPFTQHIFCHPTSSEIFACSLLIHRIFCSLLLLCILVPYIDRIFCHPTNITCSVTLHTHFILPTYISPARFSPVASMCTAYVFALYTSYILVPYTHNKFCHPTFLERDLHLSLPCALHVLLTYTNCILPPYIPPPRCSRCSPVTSMCAAYSVTLHTLYSATLHTPIEMSPVTSMCAAFLLPYTHYILPAYIPPPKYSPVTSMCATYCVTLHTCDSANLRTSSEIFTSCCHVHHMLLYNGAKIIWTASCVSDLF